MKAITLIFVLIFICGCIASDDCTATNKDDAAYHSFMEKYNCRFYRFYKPKTCESEGGECISECPPVIRHYDTTTCPCGTTCCVWL